MDNLIYGIITAIICCGGYYLSWKNAYQKSDYPTALFLLIFCGLALRIYAATDFFLHEWDERFHALVAKNLLKHPLKPTLYDNPVLPYDYKDWGHNHVWLHKPPLTLWIIALSLKLFGINEIAVRIPSIIFNTSGIFLTYRIAQFFTDNKTAYLSALLFSMNGFIIELTGGKTTTDHVDIAFQFFILLSILFALRFSKERRTYLNILTGFFIGCAILCKWLTALIVFPVWLLAVVPDNHFSMRTVLLQLFILMAIVFIIVLPWQFYIYVHYPLEAKWESLYNLKHITETVEKHSGAWFYYLDNIRINYGDAIYLPIVWLIYKLYKKPESETYRILSLWVFVPLFFFSAVKTKMQGYLLFTSSALFIVTALFLKELTLLRIRIFKLQVSSFFTPVVLALSTRYCIERIKPFEVKERRLDWVEDLKKFNNDYGEKTFIFNYPKPIEAMFYTEATVYSSSISSNLIDSLRENGYIIYENGLPDMK